MLFCICIWRWRWYWFSVIYLQQKISQMAIHWPAAQIVWRQAHKIYQFSIRFYIADPPVCTHSSVKTIEIPRLESAVINCTVNAYPITVNFTWKFNGSAEGELLPHSMITTNGTTSTMHYKINSEKDFGTILCWASNSLGVQSKPCAIHLKPAGELHYPEKSQATLNTAYNRLDW